MIPEIFWRLEDAAGNGVYQAVKPDGTPIIPTDSPYRDGDKPQRPGPGLDGIPSQPYAGVSLGPIVLEPGGLFAFADLEQARRWFDRPQDVNRWAKAGILLAAYARRDTRLPLVTPHQAVFMPRPHARPILTLPASALYQEPSVEAQAKERLNNASL